MQEDGQCLQQRLHGTGVGLQVLHMHNTRLHVTQNLQLQQSTASALVPLPANQPASNSTHFHAIFHAIGTECQATSVALIQYTSFPHTHLPSSQHQPPPDKVSHAMGTGCQGVHAHNVLLHYSQTLRKYTNARVISPRSPARQPASTTT